MISGFRCKAEENCPLQGCYAASSDNSLPTFRNNISITFLDPLKVGPIGCRETSVRKYYSLRNNFFIFYQYIYIWLYSCLTLIYILLLLCLCIHYCMFTYLHRASWHSSATLTEVFPCFSSVGR